MLALKEFANFITLNVANLATTYDRLLTEAGSGIEARPADSRTASARRLIKTVAEACESGSSAPLHRLIEERISQTPHRQELPHPLAEIECLSQTLTPVITNLEAGKFLWQALSEVRQLILQNLTQFPAPSGQETEPAIDLPPSDPRSQFVSYLVENSQVAQVVLDDQARIQYVNPFFCALYGYQAYEVVGQPVSILSDTTEPQAHHLNLLEIAARQKVWYGEDQRQRKDGSTFPASVTFSSVRNESGEVIAYLDISRDVTERRDVQEQLRKLSRAVEQSPSVTIITNLQGRIEYANPKFYQITGYTPAEIIGQNPRILKSGETSTQAYQEMWQAISTGGEWRGELHNKKKSGELYWVTSYISPIKDSAGVITHFLSVQEDITERKRVEDQLRQLSRAVEQSANTIVITDIYGHIEYANPQFTKTTGYTNEEAIGQHTRILKSGVTPPEEYQNLWQTIAAGNEWRGEFCNKKKNGEVYWESASISPIKDEKGVITHFLAVKEDVTARRQLEQQVQKSLTHRTREVQLSTQVAQDIATINDLPNLSKRVVTEINKQLDYYHAQILLVDPATQTLTPVADYGQIGLQMLTDSYPMTLTHSLISRAAVLGTSVLRADVFTDPHWRPHPLLPDTKSELAVPIKSGQMDINAQVTALKNFIAGGLDGFVVFAIEPDIIASVTKEAIDQGLRVVGKGDDLGEANQTAGIMVDEYEVGYILGRQAGEWAKTHLPADKTLKVGVLNYRVLPQIIRREEGIIAGIKAIFGDNLKIVGNETAADPFTSMPIAERWLRKNDDLDMIVAINDAAALGAYRAVIAAGKNNSETFFVGGIDGVQEALAAIKSGGAYQATVDNSPVVMGITALRTLVASIVGRPYERAIVIDESPINRSNVDEFFEIERQIPPDKNLAGLDLSGLKIGLSMMTLTNPFFVALSRAMQHEAERLGLEMFINDPAEILGVLDVQTNVTGGLNLEDQLVIEGLCAQLSTAITNQHLEMERQQAEAQLTDERNLLRTLIDTLPDQVYAKDTQGRFLLSNLATIRHLGVATAEEVIGKTDFDYSPSELARQYYADEQTLFQSGEGLIDYEQPIFDHKTDMTRWVLSTKVPFRDNQGRVVGLVGLNRDITLQKQAAMEREQLLAETETLFQASAALNTAQTYEDILTALRQYTLTGQGTQNVSINYFDRPWTANQRPEWIEVLARWSELPQSAVSWRYPVTVFSSIDQILHPDAPTLIEDVATNPLMDDYSRQLYLEQFQARSTFFAPLVVGGLWVGYINAIYPQLTRFPEPEVRRLMSVVGQAAVGVESLRNIALAEERATQLQKLAQLETALSQANTEAEIFTALVNNMAGNQPDRMVLQYLETDENEQPMIAETVAIWAAGAIQPNDPDLHQCYRVDQFSLSKLWITSPQDILLVADIAADSRLDEALRALLTQFHVAAFVNLPLRSGNRWQGLLGLDWAEPHTFSEVEQNLFRQMLEPVAAVVARRRAFLAQAEARKKSERLAHRERLLHELSSTMRQSLDPATILTIGLKAMGDELDQAGIIAELNIKE